MFIVLTFSTRFFSFFLSPLLSKVELKKEEEGHKQKKG